MLKGLPVTTDDPDKSEEDTDIQTIKVVVQHSSLGHPSTTQCRNHLRRSPLFEARCNAALTLFPVR